LKIIYCLLFFFNNKYNYTNYHLKKYLINQFYVIVSNIVVWGSFFLGSGTFIPQFTVSILLFSAYIIYIKILYSNFTIHRHESFFCDVVCMQYSVYKEKWKFYYSILVGGSPPPTVTLSLI